MSHVIEVDFGRPPEPEPLLELAASVRVLYADEHVVLVRNHFVINGKEYIQHVMADAGCDAT